MSATAYPLQWPPGWPRTPYGSRQSQHNFGGRLTELSFDRCRRELQDELRRLGATNAVLSTNVPLRNDGEPYAGAYRKQMNDPGVAVYFILKKRAMVMAQDRYTDIAANIRSLTLAIEGMRQLNRHGGGTMMERAFSGFAALPPPEGVKPKRPWWQVLRYSDKPEERELLSIAEVTARFRTLATRVHPDVGGNSDDMAELNVALEEAKQELGNVAV